MMKRARNIGKLLAKQGIEIGHLDRPYINVHRKLFEEVFNEEGRECLKSLVAERFTAPDPSEKEHKVVMVTANYSGVDICCAMTPEQYDEFVECHNDVEMLEIERTKQRQGNYNE